MAIASGDPRIGAHGLDDVVTQAPNWHGLVAWDMFLNNLTTGLFLVAVLGELTMPKVFAPLAAAAYPLALVLLVGDLMCLVLDLGHPLRFHHMLRVFKPSSPMSLGTWCLTGYSMILSLVVAIEALGTLKVVVASGPIGGWVRWLALVSAIPFAVGSAAYKGVLFSTSSQPAWKNARWLGGYLFNSAVLLGCAEMLILSLVMGREKSSALLRPGLSVLLTLNLIPLGLLIAEILPELTRRFTSGALVRIGVVSIGGGAVVPLGLLLGIDHPIAVPLAVSGLLLGSLMIRFVIVKLPHTVTTVG